MTPVQMAAYIRLMTRTNSTTFTDADIIILMRQRQDSIAEAILKADEDILLIPQTLDLVASSITTREYPLPTDILSRIKRVEAKLDGSNWLKLTEMDITKIQTPIATEADITKYFTNETCKCHFDILRKSIYIYSGTITAGTDTMKIYVDTYPTAITDLTSGTDMSVDPTTTTHGIPRPLHRIWAIGVIIDYKSSREKPIPLTEREKNYELDLSKGIETLKHGNMDREVIADIPDQITFHGSDGSEF